MITFTTVFVILFFIFILQTVWLFISELAGKDLEILLILKFLLFAMPRIIPMVLPLSVLLASIMTFGNLAENYEFAAMKSSGISLQRSMRGLTVFIVILSLIAFVFANNVIPFAEYKFINFRRNIAQRSPAMAIAEGQFSEIGNYTIKVDKKSGDKGNLLDGVIIHIKSQNGDGNKTVIKAKRGELISSETSNTLKLVLYDGNYYEDITPKKYEERERMPFAKATFKKDVINIDLSKLNTNTETGEIANTNTMLNVGELNYTLDSLNTNYRKDIKSFTENIYQRINISNKATNFSIADTTTPTKKTNFNKNLLADLDNGKKTQAIKYATTNVESTVFSIESSKFEMEEKQKNINQHWIALYEKFVIAFSCILMFFIGAPLGAIIRKGGLGMPIVFAVTIFIIFHFINTFGKKLAQEDGITPFLGTWMSTIVLAPLAVLLTYRAIKDIGGVINLDVILVPIQNYLAARQTKNAVTQTTKEKSIAIEENELISNDVLPAPKASTLDKLDITALLLEYNKDTKITLVIYAITFAMSIVALLVSSIITALILILSIIVLSYKIFTTQKKLDTIGNFLNTKFEPGIEISITLGFPFYSIIYFYNKKALEKALKNTDN
ncbi:permease [Flavobacterium aquatile]|nr:permease [Flavobacterium aquatile] [Flavobacterium aquatile LMG 4008 = ATCC 11947]